MRKNNFALVIQFLVGVFILPEYHYNIIPITKISNFINNHNYDVGYKHQNNNKYKIIKNKSKTKIRSFNRNSKVNFQ